MSSESPVRRRISPKMEVKGALTRCHDLIKAGGHARTIYALLRSRFLKKGPHPIFLSHMVTNRCQGKCPYCFWRYPKGEEMTLKEIRHLYREAREAGFVFNNIWGGEPLLREDLTEVVQASKENSLLTTVVTNGEFLEERHAFCAHTDVLVVSLDAPGQLHDRIRGIRGLFEKAVKGLELVRTRYPQLHLNICCVLSTLNRGKIPEMMELARQIGASIYFCPVGDNASIEEWPDQERVAKYMKTLDESVEDFKVIRKYKERGYPVESSFYLIDYYIFKRGPYQCRRPWVYLNVYANGDVETCFLGTFANVREDPLREILRMRQYQQTVKKFCDCDYSCNANDAIEISGLWNLHPGALRNWL